MGKRFKLTEKQKKEFVNAYNGCVSTIINELQEYRDNVLITMVDNGLSKGFDVSDFAEMAILRQMKTSLENYTSQRAALEEANNIIDEDFEDA